MYVGGTLETGIKLLTRMLFKIHSQDKVHDIKAARAQCAQQAHQKSEAQETGDRRQAPGAGASEERSSAPAGARG